MNPLASIIIPVCNRRAAFERAIDSALGQAYGNIEIIVIDDGSTEDIESIVADRRKTSTHEVKYRRQTNQGPGAARKNGLAAASGIYIQYLDADDVIFPEKIKRQVALLAAHPSAAVCLSGWETFDEKSAAVIGWKDTGLPADLLGAALSSRPWPTTAPLWRYPNKAVVNWPALYSGEDVVHDVSVGIHQRDIAWLREVQSRIYISSHSLSQESKRNAMRSRRLNDSYAVPNLCFSLLQKSGLLTDCRYSEPLAERCFRTGLQFAMIGDGERSRQLLKLAQQTSRQWKKRLEVFMAHACVALSQARMPLLYRGVYSLHKLITPYRVYAGKKITNLVP
jgi:glycosyltransferase involved in cell wall biosynthesis